MKMKKKELLEILSKMNIKSTRNPPRYGFKTKKEICMEIGDVKDSGNGSKNDPKNSKITESDYLEKAFLFASKKKNLVQKKLKVVCEILGVEISENKMKLCKSLMDKISSSEQGKTLMKMVNEKIPTNRHCQVVVDVLYYLVFGDTMPLKSPIGKIKNDGVPLSEKEYLTLIDMKIKDIKMTKRMNENLQNALLIKYCHCIKKMFLTSELKQMFEVDTRKFDETDNPYALCRYSVYRKGKIEPELKEKRLSDNCRNPPKKLGKFNWF